jgi:hypothetical protein
VFPSGRERRDGPGAVQVQQQGRVLFAATPLVRQSCRTVESGGSKHATWRPAKRPHRPSPRRRVRRDSPHWTFHFTPRFTYRSDDCVAQQLKLFSPPAQSRPKRERRTGRSGRRVTIDGRRGLDLMERWAPKRGLSPRQSLTSVSSGSRPADLRSRSGQQRRTDRTHETDQATGSRRRR